MRNFWNEFNEQLGFIYVAGVPTTEFTPYINSMAPELLHFVPAVSDSVALGLVTGAFIAGFKACLFLPDTNFELIRYQFYKVNRDLSLPLIILTNGEENPFKLKQFYFDKDWQRINDYVYKDNKSAILVIR